MCHRLKFGIHFPVQHSPSKKGQNHCPLMYSMYSQYLAGICGSALPATHQASPLNLYLGRNTWSDADTAVVIKLFSLAMFLQTQEATEFLC
jgi:hypothetical protein